MNQKPKLLIVADTYYPKIDGVLRFLEEFISRSRSNFELTLLVPQFEHQKPFKQIETLFLETSRLFHLSTYPSIKLSFSNLKKIKKAVRQADLLFVQDAALAGYLSIYYAQKFSKKIIFYSHQVLWKQFPEVASPLVSKLTPLVKYLTLRALNHCHLFLIPYFGLKKEMAEEGITAEMQVARLGIDISRFAPSSNKKLSKDKLKLPHKFIIGYVGRISPEKNTLTLLQAFHKLDQEKFFLLIVGDGQPETVEKFRQNKNCLVTGFVDNVEDYLQAMDIFVMPSLIETTSLATLEAMSCGLPVIVTKVGFIKEYVVKDYNGLFFPRANPTLLALKIEKLLRNPKFRQRLSHQARQTVAYAFSWERSINKIKKIIFKLYYRP